VQIPVGVSPDEGEGGGPQPEGDDFSIIETTPTSVHTQVLVVYLKGQYIVERGGISGSSILSSLTI
jgi:hypothetical protein